MTDLILQEEYDRMQDIAVRLASGENATSIARSLGMQRKDVLATYNQWKEVALNDEVLRERSREVVAQADAHYDKIIREYWSIIDNSYDDKVKVTALKHVADVDAKRIEFLQRTGLLEDQALADQMAETEEKAQAISELLKSVASVYPETRKMIAEGLGRIFNQPVGTPMPGGDTTARA